MIIDSGSGFDLVGKRFLSKYGRSDIKESAKPLYLSTANGKVRADWKAVVEVEKLGIETEAIVLDDCPSV